MSLLKTHHVLFCVICYSVCVNYAIHICLVAFDRCSVKPKLISDIILSSK